MPFFFQTKKHQTFYRVLIYRPGLNARRRHLRSSTRLYCTIEDSMNCNLPVCETDDLLNPQPLYQKIRESQQERSIFIMEGSGLRESVLSSIMRILFQEL